MPILNRLCRSKGCLILAAILTGAAVTTAPAYSQFVLNPVAGLPGVSAGSVAWGDYDGDGRLDFLLSGSLSTSLWQNTGHGFSNVTATAAPGLPSLYDSAVAWGDFDNDGRLDLLITGLTNFIGGAVAQVWRNTGSQFTNVPIPGLLGIGESSAAWVDYDNDGRLDFLISGTTNGVSSGAISQLWRNTGNGFTNVPIPGLAGVLFGALAWGDFDNDGHPDFLITGLTNSNTGEAMTQLWRNTGNGFTNVPIPGLRGVYLSSVAWADYDNDGLLDFLLEGLNGTTFISELWHNTGDGFVNVPVPGLPGIADGSLAWGDYDNDGRIDFLITGLTNGASKVSQIWRNAGAGFVNIPIAGLDGNFDNSVAWGDFDNDSRLDFLLSGTIEGGTVSQIWRNTSPAANSPPTPPTGLSSTVAGNAIVLNWNISTDDHTPGAGLSYNVRVGTTPGGSDVVSAPALSNGKLLVPQMGSVRGNSFTLRRPSPRGTYYWSVQAVDSSFAGSTFSAEQQIIINPALVNPIRLANGDFQFKFAGIAGGNFTVLASTNASLPLGNWTFLGAPLEISPGQFQFIDTQTAIFPQRAYRIRSP